MSELRGGCLCGDGTTVALHHHVASKADWDEIPKDLPQFEAYPPLEVVFGDE